jgi:hypothetical protein
LLHPGERLVEAGKELVVDVAVWVDVVVFRVVVVLAMQFPWRHWE